MSTLRRFTFDVPESDDLREILEERLSEVLASSGAFGASLRSTGRNLMFEFRQPYGNWGSRDRADAIVDAALYAARDRVHKLLQENAVYLVRDELLEFRDFVERQGYRAVVIDGTPREEIGRTLLQAFLVNRSYREVPVRGGRSDLLIYLNYGRRILIETKIWRGPHYHEQAIAELGEYARGENDDGRLAASFLVVFDNTEGGMAAQYLSDSRSQVAGNREQLLIPVPIRLNLPQPSKTLKDPGRDTNHSS